MQSAVRQKFLEGICANFHLKCGVSFELCKNTVMPTKPISSFIHKSIIFRLLLYFHLHLSKTMFCQMNFHFKKPLWTLYLSILNFWPKSNFPPIWTATKYTWNCKPVLPLLTMWICPNIMTIREIFCKMSSVQRIFFSTETVVQKNFL